MTDNCAPFSTPAPVRHSGRTQPPLLVISTGAPAPGRGVVEKSGWRRTPTPGTALRRRHSADQIPPLRRPLGGSGRNDGWGAKRRRMARRAGKREASRLFLRSLLLVASAGRCGRTSGVDGADIGRATRRVKEINCKKGIFWGTPGGPGRMEGAGGPLPLTPLRQAQGRLSPGGEGGCSCGSRRAEAGKTYGIRAFCPLPLGEGVRGRGLPGNPCRRPFSLCPAFAEESNYGRNQ